MIYTPTEAQSLMTSHLLAHPVAALFAGMGLGKTAATLDAANTLITDMDIDAALVIAPLRVATMTWPAEVAKWDHTAWMRIADLRTAHGRKMLQTGGAQLYIINFDMLQQFAAWVGKAKEVPFQAVVIDELSMAKDPSSKRIKAVRPLLWRFCRYRWGLTGTPTPNSRLDLFAPFLLLDQGERLGKSFTHFRQTHFKQADYWGYKWEEHPEAPERIRAAIADVTISLKTSDWLDLPDLNEHDVAVKMQDKPLEIYKTMEKDFLVKFAKTEAVALNAAVQVTKLLQITSGAVYVDDGKTYELIHDIKVDAVVKLLKKVEGNTIVVYQYRHELERLQRAIPDAVSFYEADLTGWNAGRIKTLLCHPKSMSHGLNLQHGGSNVVWISPTYSRELYDQLNARLYRRGQDKPTNVYRILADNTIDWVVVEALRSKGDGQNALLTALSNYAKK